MVFDGPDTDDTEADCTEAEVLGFELSAGDDHRQNIIISFRRRLRVRAIFFLCIIAKRKNVTGMIPVCAFKREVAFYRRRLRDT